MNVEFIKSTEKKKILAELEEFYGIEELNYMLIETGKKKIRGFSGSLTREEMFEMSKYVNIELIGMYIISKKDEDLRLNFDAVSLFRNEITKSIVEINKEQLEKWIRGHDLDMLCQRGLVVLSCDGDLVGIGKSNGERVFNYVPKERCVKSALRAKTEEN